MVTIKYLEILKKAGGKQYTLAVSYFIRGKLWLINYSIQGGSLLELVYTFQW